MVPAAVRAAQHFEVTPEGTVAAGIGGAVDANYWTAQGTSEMERAGVSCDAERYQTGDGDELAKRAFDGHGCSGGDLNDSVGEGFFAGADIDHDAESLGDKINCYGGIPLGRPALGAPSGAGVYEDRGATGGQDLSSPGIGDLVSGKQRRNGREVVPGNGGGQFQILLDDVNAARCDFLGIEPTGKELSGIRLSDDPAATGRAGCPRGADRSLEIDDGIIAGGAEIAAQNLDFREGLTA